MYDREYAEVSGYAGLEELYLTHPVVIRSHGILSPIHVVLRA